MPHKLYHVTQFALTEQPYTIWVQFDDGSEQTINFEPILRGQLYGPLRDLDVFNQVKIDPIARTLSWPNGADFDPETLRNWPQHKDRLIQRAQSWNVPALAANPGE